MHRSLTTVTQEFRVHQRNYRVLFGQALDVVTVDDHCSRVYFTPGTRFGIDLWDCNVYGTTHWRVLICRAVFPGEIAQKIRHVHPGAHVLLDVRGATRCRAALQWIAHHIENGRVPPLSEEHLTLSEFRLNRLPLARLKGYSECR